VRQLPSALQDLVDRTPQQKAPELSMTDLEVVSPPDVDNLGLGRAALELASNIFQVPAFFLG
jgi:hypothetical protein